MKTYEVVCERDGKWWLVRVPEVPGALSQVARIDQVEEHAREAIAMVLDVAEDSFAVTVRVEVPEEARRLVDSMLAARAEAEAGALRAQEQSREVVNALAGEGFSYRDIGALLGVSFQRVAQLAK